MERNAGRREKGTGREERLVFLLSCLWPMESTGQTYRGKQRAKQPGKCSSLGYRTKHRRAGDAQHLIQLRNMCANKKAFHHKLQSEISPKNAQLFPRPSTTKLHTGGYCAIPFLKDFCNQFKKWFQIRTTMMHHVLQNHIHRIFQTNS